MTVLIFIYLLIAVLGITFTYLTVRSLMEISEHLKDIKSLLGQFLNKK